MALARIITRSQACSRELALDLLARGYTVEIVSPDAIPDNFADLELRVEEDPGNQLVANVATHNGERSASLDFVHYLKTPVPDFVRRPPEPTIAAAQPLLDFEPAKPSIALPPQAASAAVEIPGYFPVEEPVIANLPMDGLPLIHPTTAESTSLRSAGWHWRAALTFAGVVTMALVLAFGLRRNGSASAQSAAGAPDEKVAATSADANLLSPSDAFASAALIGPTASPRLKEARTPVAVAKIASSSKSVASRKNPRGHGDDVVARDTVTYLDTRFAPRAIAKASSKVKLAKQESRKPSRRRKHRDEVVAASKVTYLDKGTPKAAK
jgi:hypothetical protein